MKQKKTKGMLRVLYMAVAVALVIAISISATLAFLTDSTAVRDNQFIGESTDVKGRILEPAFTQDVTYTPGDSFPKNPQVQNESTNDVIFTGLRLRFYIRTASSGDYQQVDYATFAKYAKISYISNATGPVYTDGFNESAWTDVTTAAVTAGGSNLNKYFVYKKAVGTGATTTPIFDKVDMSKFINIPADTTSLPAGVTLVGNTKGNIDTAADNLTAENQFNQAFSCCEFQIKVDGYAIKANVAADTAIDTTGDGNSQSTITTKLAAYDSL